MNGYAFVTSACCACGAWISYHPHKVPSIRVNGHREPLCRGCFARWNEIHRLDQGMPALLVDTEAYEPCPVEEL